MVVLRPIDNGFIVETRDRNRYFERLDDALTCIKETVISAGSLSDEHHDEPDPTSA